MRFESQQPLPTCLACVVDVMLAIPVIAWYDIVERCLAWERPFPLPPYRYPQYNPLDNTMVLLKVVGCFFISSTTMDIPRIIKYRHKTKNQTYIYVSCCCISITIMFFGLHELTNTKSVRNQTKIWQKFDKNYERYSICFQLESYTQFKTKTYGTTTTTGTWLPIWFFVENILI